MTEPTRDRYGRPMLLPVNGGAKRLGYTRATTLAKTLEDEGSLSKWKMRQVAVGLAARPDLLALASTASGDKGKLDRIAQQALDAAASDSRANLGTALHSLVETIVGGGTPIGVLPALQSDLDAFRAVAATLELASPETFVVNDTWMVAGTFDFLVKHRGRWVIGDLKTGADLSYSWRSIAVQCATYANAEWVYDVETDTRKPMPDIDKTVAIIVHLPAGEGRCELYEVDLVAGLEAAERSLWTRNWRKAKVATPVDIEAKEWQEMAVASIGARLDAEERSDRRAWLIERIDGLKAIDGGLAALQRHWPMGVATFKQSDAHDDEQLDLIQRGIEAAEAAVRAPFEAEPPGGSPEPAPLPVLEAPKAKAHFKPVPVTTTPPDEGAESDDLLVDVKVIREQVIEANGKEAAGRWAAEANAAGASISMNRGTERRHAIGRILLRVPELGEDVVRALVAHVIASDQPLFPTTPFGAAVGCMSAAEAAEVARLCISDGVELGVNADGRTVVTALAPVA